LGVAAKLKGKMGSCTSAKNRRRRGFKRKMSPFRAGRALHDNVSDGEVVGSWETGCGGRPGSTGDSLAKER